MLVGKDHEIFLCVAKQLARFGNCNRRNYGAILVSENKEILSMGASNPPPLCTKCNKGKCKRDVLKVSAGERYEICRSVHAEQECLIKANYSKVPGSTMYLVGLDIDGQLLENPFVCNICKKMLIYAKVERVILPIFNSEEHRTEYVKDWIDFI